jgi:hypothetical protein
MERPQVDTNMAALVQRRCVDARMVVSVVCAAFQAIAEHAGNDQADDEGGVAPRYSTDNRLLSHSRRFYGIISRAIRKKW